MRIKRIIIPKVFFVFICLTLSLSGFGQYLQKHLRNGDSAYAYDHYRKAIRYYKIAIEVDPYSPEAYLGRADCKRALNRHKRAIRDYNKCIYLDPENDVAYNHRGFSNMSLGRYHEAIIDFTRAIKINSKFWGYYSNRGDARSQLKDFQGAADDYLVAMTLNPSKDDSADILFKIAMSKNSLGEKEGACIYFEKALKAGIYEAADFIKQNCP